MPIVHGEPSIDKRVVVVHVLTRFYLLTECDGARSAVRDRRPWFIGTDKMDSGDLRAKAFVSWSIAILNS